MCDAIDTIEFLQKNIGTELSNAALQITQCADSIEK